MPSTDVAPEPRTLVLTDRPVPWRDWFADLVRHREVLGVLVRKDFQTRYKRATLGVLWAVVVPVVQAGLVAVVFSRVAKAVGGGGREDYGAYVMSGMLAWSYFGTTLSSGSTAIVDASGLTDKVWFPRALMTIIPSLANLVSLFVSFTVLVMLLPVINGHYDKHLLLLVPAVLLLVMFTIAVTLVLSALHVYFRDVRFIVQAATIAWMYITPIVFTQDLLGGLAPVVSLNPMTGVIHVFHLAFAPRYYVSYASIAYSVAATFVLFVIGLVAQHRYDRLFVDLL